MFSNIDENKRAQILVFVLFLKEEVSLSSLFRRLHVKFHHTFSSRRICQVAACFIVFVQQQSSTRFIHHWQEQRSVSLQVSTVSEFEAPPSLLLSSISDTRHTTSPRRCEITTANETMRRCQQLLSEGFWELQEQTWSVEATLKWAWPRLRGYSRSSSNCRVFQPLGHWSRNVWWSKRPCGNCGSLPPLVKHFGCPESVY